MGKHNGKARKNGLSVGGALVNRARRDGRTGSAAAYIHTTEVVQNNGMQSVIETNDLVEMMNIVSAPPCSCACPPPRVGCLPPVLTPPPPPPPFACRPSSRTATSRRRRSTRWW
jgi:hypothetical protein